MRWRRRSSDRGATIVEFAMALPVLVLLLVGLFTGANFVNRQLQINHAAGEGARFGASLDVSPTWASTVADHVLSQAVGDFTAADVCVALVRGTGNTPTLVTAGTALDPSVRVVVRIATQGTIDWVVGTSAQSYDSTSSALWEPVSEYVGAGGVSAARITGPASVSSPSGSTCAGDTGDNRYAYVPTATPCVPAAQSVDLSSTAALAAFTRTPAVGSGGGVGTTLVQTRTATGCDNPLTVTWAVAEADSEGATPTENLSVVTNAGTAPLSWAMGTPTAPTPWDNPTPLWPTGRSAVLVSNLEHPCPGALGLCADGERGHITLTLTFSRPVTGLAFDLVHLEHDQSGAGCTGSRYEQVSLDDGSGADLAGQAGSVSYSANTPPPDPGAQGVGTLAAPWTANVQPSAVLSPCPNGWSASVAVTVPGPVTTVRVRVADRNANDGDPAGWFDDPTNGTADLQAGIANMSFTYT